MPKLRLYWFLPTITRAFLVPDIKSRFDRTQSVEINPQKLKWDKAGSCLFSTLERRHGYVKCWLYNFTVAEDFKDRTTRNKHIFWVDPALLKEMVGV
jgi:hypothetical protein